MKKLLFLMPLLIVLAIPCHADDWSDWSYYRNFSLNEDYSSARTQAGTACGKDIYIARRLLKPI